MDVPTSRSADSVGGDVKSMGVPDSRDDAIDACPRFVKIESESPGRFRKSATGIDWLGAVL